MAMGINVQIYVDLKFLCGSYTKIRKPHLLAKRPNFFARKELATFPRATVLGGHETDRIVSQYVIMATLLIYVRHAVRIIFAEAFARRYFGQQS